MKAAILFLDETPQGLEVVVELVEEGSCGSGRLGGLRADLVFVCCVGWEFAGRRDLRLGLLHAGGAIAGDVLEQNLDSGYEHTNSSGRVQILEAGDDVYGRLSSDSFAVIIMEHVTV